MATTFATALADLGATGRAIAALAAPILDPIEVPAARRHEPAAPMINIVVNIVTASEEPQ